MYISEIMTTNLKALKLNVLTHQCCIEERWVSSYSSIYMTEKAVFLHLIIQNSTVVEIIIKLKVKN